MLIKITNTVGTITYNITEYEKIGQNVKFNVYGVNHLTQISECNKVKIIYYSILDFKDGTMHNVNNYESAKELIKVFRECCDYPKSSHNRYRIVAVEKAL